VQDEAAVDLHRSAEMHGCLRQAVILELQVDLFEQGVQLHVDRAVDDDAHGAILVVLTDEGDGSCKIRVCHRRHCDQEVAGEIYIFHEAHYLINISWINSRAGASGFQITCHFQPETSHAWHFSWCRHQLHFADAEVEQDL